MCGRAGRNTLLCLAIHLLACSLASCRDMGVVNNVREKWDGAKFLQRLDESDTPESLLSQIPDDLEITNPLTPFGGLGKPFHPECNFDNYLPCAAPPSPLLNIDTFTPYLTWDKSRSKWNFTAVKRNDEIISSITSFLQGLGNISSTYWACRQGGLNSELAKCTVSWITAWARASALGVGTSKNTGHGNKIVAFSTSGIAIPYLRVMDDPAISSSDKSLAEAWLGKLTDIVVDTQGNTGNNIRYWSGLDTLTVGIATQRVDLIRWSVAAYLKFLDNVRDDGLLASEMFREMLVSSYHAFAVRPVMFIAWLAKNSINLDLTQLKDFALRKVVSNTARMVLDTNYIRQLVPSLPDQSSGAIQMVDAAEVFNRYNNDEDVKKVLEQHRPAYSERFGGFITMTWGTDL